jgi:hypothetical protein
VGGNPTHNFGFLTLKIGEAMEKAIKLEFG